MFKETLNTRKSFLIYRIGDNLFASDSDQVRNIVDTTFIVKDSEQQSLIININGKEIPVFNISEIIGNKKPESTNQLIIVMEIKNYKSQITSFIVDEVKELIDIQNENCIKIPMNEIKYCERYINKMVKINNEFIGILDIENLVNSEVDVIKNQFSKQKHAICQ
ncbi:MAG TPA: hypothetical protein DCG75_18370 [Bacteroidales bacterium]|jgi:chemotaxis signal transduction protein|nr:hypothetical protein [Bacteroidales bacterium]